MSAHARLSPSGSRRWMSCPGSLVLEQAFPDVGSDYSDAGTAQHTVASQCLTALPWEHQYATPYIGRLINVADQGEEDRFVQFTQAMAETVNDYITAVRGKLTQHTLVEIEQRVDFSEFVGVPGQFGTADAIMLHPLEDGTYELDVTDLKTGFKVVRPDNNSQLMLYALGAYRMYELSHEITQVRLSIFQPEQGGMVEWRCTIGDLMAFAATARTAAERTVQAANGATDAWSITPEWEATYLNPDPNEQDCAFCRAMATCPSMRRKMERTVGMAFEVISEEGVELDKLQVADEGYLSKAMRAAGVLEDWILSVRAEVERRLLTGVPVDGYGLELGREGARAWVSPLEVERYLKKSLRLTDDVEEDAKADHAQPRQAEREADREDHRAVDPARTGRQCLRRGARRRRSLLGSREHGRTQGLQAAGVS
jgi:hypothetical protein